MEFLNEEPKEIDPICCICGKRDGKYHKAVEESFLDGFPPPNFTHLAVCEPCQIVLVKQIKKKLESEMRFL